MGISAEGEEIVSTWICLPGTVCESETVTAWGSACSDSRSRTTTNLRKKVFIVKKHDHLHRWAVVENPGGRAPF
jgi:hypothetical protein